MNLSGPRILEKMEGIFLSERNMLNRLAWLSRVGRNGSINGLYDMNVYAWFTHKYRSEMKRKFCFGTRGFGTLYILFTPPTYPHYNSSQL